MTITSSPYFRVEGTSDIPGLWTHSFTCEETEAQREKGLYPPSNSAGAFIRKTFIEHLLDARCCARGWGLRAEQIDLPHWTCGGGGASLHGPKRRKEDREGET